MTWAQKLTRKTSDRFPPCLLPIFSVGLLDFQVKLFPLFLPLLPRPAWAGGKQIKSLATHMHLTPTETQALPGVRNIHYKTATKTMKCGLVSQCDRAKMLRHDSGHQTSAQGHRLEQRNVDATPGLAIIAKSLRFNNPFHNSAAIHPHLTIFCQKTLHT